MTENEVARTIVDLVRLRLSSEHDSALCYNTDTLIDFLGFALCACDSFHNNFGKTRSLHNPSSNQ